MDLKLQVLLGMIEKVTAPLKAITGRSTETARALRDTRARVRDLQKQLGAVDAFRTTSNESRKLATELRDVRARASAAGAAMAKTAAPTKAQAKGFAELRAQVKSAEQAFVANQAKLRGVREQLAAAGISTKSLASEQVRLKSAITTANGQIAEQQKRLAGVAAQEQRMAAARTALQKSQGTGAHLAIAGVASMATGRHVLDSVRPSIDEAKAFQQQVVQLRSQGVGDQAVDDAVKYARGMDIIGSSATDNLKLLKEANSVLRDMHEAEQVTPYLAKMKFGIETIMAQGGHGEGHGDNAEAMFMDLLKVAELRGAVKNPESLKRVLDYATQAYVASGGLVKPEDLLNMIKTGGVAAKQLDDKSFFFGLLHTMQEMGGHRAGTGLATAYQNWAAGRSTQQSAEELYKLGLLNKDSVQYGTTGHVKKVLPDALKEGELYRSNPFEYLMTRVIPKINPHGALNDQQVVSKINALFSGRKGGDLFASLYLERNNIAKHLAAAPKAYGVDALYKEAGGTASGVELDLDAKKRDLYRELGTQVLPTYVAGLGKLVAGLRYLNGFAEAHPRLARALMLTAAGFGTVMTAAGGVMIAMGALVSQLAFVRFAFQAAGIKLGGLFGNAAAAGGEAVEKAGLLSRAFTIARTAVFGLAGASMATVGIVAAVLAVVVGVVLVIRKYWGPIVAWFQGVGQGIAQGITPAFNEIREALGPLGAAFGTLARWAGIVWDWFKQLITPVVATKDQLDAARANGVSFGQVIGAALGRIVQGFSMPIRLVVWFGQALGTAAGWIVTKVGQGIDGLGSLVDTVRAGVATAWSWLTGLGDRVGAFLSPVGEAFATLGRWVASGASVGAQALAWLWGKASDVAGGVSAAWSGVGTFFNGLWEGVKSAASTALEWISGKIDAVRRVIEQLHAMWAKVRGEMPASATPIDWIMPEDHDRAMRVRDAIARNPATEAPARPPIVAQTAASAPAAPSVNHITVNANGLNEHQARRMVADALDDHERSKASRQRSAYSDED